MNKIARTAVKKFQVVSYDDSVGNHREARKALEAAQYGRGTPYAVIDGKRVRIEGHKGALNGRAAVDSDRYLDDDGREYVMCADGHFEPAESYNSAGALVGWYSCAVIAK
jgi:hypothetical protein